MTTAEKLADAREALHRLMTGSQRAELRHGDRSVTYTQTNVAALQRYIAEL